MRKFLLCLPRAEINFSKVEDEIAHPKDHRTFSSFKNCKAVRHRGFLNQTAIHPLYLGVTGVGLSVLFAVWKIAIKRELR